MAAKGFDHDVVGDGQDSLLKTTLKELVVYVVFLVVLCLVAFLVVSPAQFYFTKVLRVCVRLSVLLCVICVCTYVCLWAHMDKSSGVLTPDFVL